MSEIGSKLQTNSSWKTGLFARPSSTLGTEPGGGERLKSGRPPRGVERLKCNHGEEEHSTLSFGGTWGGRRRREGKVNENKRE
jgi:hypothetical protein